MALVLGSWECLNVFVEVVGGVSADRAAYWKHGYTNITSLMSDDTKHPSYLTTPVSHS